MANFTQALSEQLSYWSNSNEKEVKAIEESDAAAMFYKTRIIPVMEHLRFAVDQAETLCPSDKWCYPSYGELLFSVR